MPWGGRTLPYTTPTESVKINTVNDLTLIVYTSREGAMDSICKMHKVRAGSWGVKVHIMSKGSLHPIKYRIYHVKQLTLLVFFHKINYDFY